MDLYNSRLFESVINNIYNYFDFSESRKRYLSEIIFYANFKDLILNKRTKVNISDDEINLLVDVYGYFVKSDIPIFKKIISETLANFKFDDDSNTFDLVGDKIIIDDIIFPLNEKIKSFIKDFGKNQTLEFIGNNIFTLQNIYPIKNKQIEYLKHKHNLTNEAYFGNVYSPKEHILKPLDLSKKGNWIIRIPPNITLAEEIVDNIDKSKDKTFLIIYYTKLSFLLEKSKKIKAYLAESDKFENYEYYHLLYNYNIYLNSQIKYVLVKT